MKTPLKKQPAMIIALTICACSCSLMLSRETNAQSHDSDPRVAVILDFEGAAQSKEANASWSEIKRGQILPVGSVVKTGSQGKVDLYFRQIGTIIRLMPQTELTLEKLHKEMKNGVLVKETVLDMKSGRILAVVRVLVEDSKVEIKTPACSYLMPTAGVGRYDIRSDGTALVGKKSRLSLKALAGGKATTVEPGQKFSSKTAKVEQIDTKTLQELLGQMDELQAIATALTPPPRPEELPKR
ncbi:MAG: hypothetical protein AB1813_17860 [Verrucomicrobiota bacterium]